MADEETVVAPPPVPAAGGSSEDTTAAATTTAPAEETAAAAAPTPAASAATPPTAGGAGAGAGAGVGAAAPAPAAAAAAAAKTPAPLAARTAAHFAVNSPAGRVGEAMAEVNVIVPDGSLSDENKVKVYRRYNTKNFVGMPCPDGSHKVIICADSEVDPAHYIDSVTGQVVAVDHVKQTTSDDGSGAATAHMDATLEPQRAALLTALQKVVTATYGDRGVCGVFAKDGTITAVLSGIIVNARSNWSGYWRSRYTVAVADGSCSVEGQVQMGSQYSEFGNVQMSNEKNMPAKTIAFATAEEFGSAVAKHIRNSDDSHSTAVFGAVANVSKVTLKGIRRHLPITGVPMNWNVGANRFTTQLMRAHS